MNIVTPEIFFDVPKKVPMAKIQEESTRYKRIIQLDIIPSMTRQELYDVRDCRVNLNVIDRLCQLGANEVHTASVTSLYACAVAVGTIIKEYEWGEDFLSPNGLYALALQISDKMPIYRF